MRTETSPVMTIGVSSMRFTWRAESAKMIATTERTLSRRLGTLPAARAIDKATTDAKLAPSPSSPTVVGIALIGIALIGVIGGRRRAT